ncbi:MAG TPA: BREX system ATP-binding domain-containing protein [Pyrinomonadaceae bacterium]|nr:BREX system ATP-binding domain-containing protein [Pyrinomonadaceae bacterium]
MIEQTLSNRYQILSELGRGGMGVVYRALDPLLNREVAIKLIPPTLLTPETEQRFQREAQLVAQMDHPAVVPIFDFGKHEGSLFFVMPVVQGTNLRWFEREAALTLGEVLDIGIQIAEALEYSHSRGVIHRDIKPENIMVTREEGGKIRVRVMDFGLARGAAESRITKTGTIAGTLAYMSPEQVAASGIDHRSDIYSLGTVLYECLTGEPPFLGELQSILYRIVHEIPQPPRSLGADINEDLETAILACIAKEPAKRPQRATEVAESLRRCQTRLNHSDLTKSVIMTKTMMLPRVALSPFIGREKELAELQKRLNAAISGECQFVVVSGEPGSGKTRLLDEIEHLAKARKLLVLHGRSIEKDGAFPYQGFCEAIQEYFRLKEAPSSGSGSIELADIAPDLLSLFPMLTEISEIRSALTGESKVSQPVVTQGPDNRTHIFELLARTLTRLAGGKPLILLLEDLHAAEISIEALQYIVRRLGPTPTLIAVTYRSTDVDQRHPLSRMLDTFRGDRRFTTIALGPFSASEHRHFLETLIGGPKLSDTLVERLYEATEGNPFFTKELVRSLLDSGGISKDQTGAWVLTGATDLSTGDLPATIQQAVEKRIERLPDNLREILSIASVIGRAFDFRELRTLAEGKDVEEAIDHLIEDGLVEEERESRGDRLTFSSGVVRDVLYSGVPRRKRRSLHRKYAEQIEKRHSGRLERIYPQLVHHFSQGDVPDKTVEYALRLARNALDAFSAEDAFRAAKTALDFLDEEWEGDPLAEGEARMLLAQAHQMTGDIDGALKEAEAAIRIFESENQPALSVKPLLFAAETAWQARRVEETTRWVNKGIEAAQNSGENESLRHLLSLAATLANLRGVYEKANEYLEQAENLAPTGKGSEAQEEIPRGGKLVVALATPVEVVEPVNMELVEEQEILANVFEPLLTLDPEGNLMPALCERWEFAGEGTSLLLTIRSRVAFQDGHHLTAEDVKRSFERSIGLVAREMPAAFAAIRGVTEFSQGQAREVSGIVVHSEQKLEIQLLQPLSIYPALLTDYKTALTRSGADGDIALGTGPFRFASYAPDRILLERNEDYWKGAAAALDAIEFRPGLSAKAIAAGLRSGDIDLARDLGPQDLDDFLRDPRFRGGLVEVPRKTTYFVLFNTMGNSAATDLRVRQALSGVVRTHDLVWQTLGRFAQPAVCVIPPGMLGHDPGKRRTALSREQAQELLRSAGISGEIHLKAAVHPLFQDRYKSLLTALSAIWAELGVQVENVTSTMAPYLESFQQSAGLDLFIGRWNADYDDPDDFTHGLFHSRVGQFRSYISASDGDQILAEARTESRPNVRASLYRKYENYLFESATVLPLFHDIDYRLANSKVRGLRLRSGAPFVNYAELGLLESSAAAGDAPLRTGTGIIHVPVTGVIQSIDPSLAATVEDGEVLPNIFESLTVEVGARIVPWLAAEFRMEEGGRRYRFRLRDNVRFHDGRRLTARDVRYSFERFLSNPASISRMFYTNIRGARELLNGEARDLTGFRIQSAHDFTIELEEPISFFPAMLSYSAAAIVPEGSEQFEGNWQEGCVGTGPFRVVKFTRGHRLELERNKNYWRKGYPKSESLVFSFGVAPAEILSEFRAGRFSVASDLLPADAEALRREPEFASGYRESPRLITYYAAFNTHRGPLSDKSLRQSLARSIDVPGLVRQTLGRLAVPAQGLIPPGLLGHDSSLTPRTSTGLPPLPEQRSAEVELSAVLNPVFFGEFAAMSRAFANSLREQRVKLRVVNKTMEEWLDFCGKANVDLVVGRWAADYPDPDTFATILASKEGLLGQLCGSPELDRLIERGRAETSPTARHGIYRQIEELIARECLLLPLFHEQTYRFARPEVEGLSLSYSAPAVDYASLRT